MRRRKWILIVVACILSAFLAASAWWVIYDRRARTTVETVIADLEARGIARTIADFDADKPREEENAAPLLEEACELAESIPPLPESDADWKLPDVPESVRKRIPLYDPVCELIYRAVERPRCRFDTGWLVQGNWEKVIAVSSFSPVTSALVARALVRSEEGDVDGALEDLRVLFGLARVLREEPGYGIMVPLVRIAIASQALKGLQLILPRCPSPVEAFERVSPDSARGAIAFGYQAELAQALWITVNTEEFFAWQGDAEKAFGDVSRLSIPRHKLDAAHLARELGNYVEIARKPYPVALKLAEAARANASLGRDGGLITATLLPQLLIVDEALHASQVALVELGAKCLEYRRDHGQYPGSLDDLPDVSLDPLTERPFLLEVLKDGIRLRSESSEPEKRGGAIEWVLKEQP